MTGTEAISSSEIFSPGPKEPQPPQGVVEREAVNALRGYAYQIGTAALAWFDLRDDERLYLEVAEDYAIYAANALHAVQVKDTAQTGNVTLNSGDIKQALVTFIELAEKNPSTLIHLHFLSTSEIGLERAVSDRPAGKPGLLYWRAAAAGADVGPIRAALARESMPMTVRSFVTSRADDAIRNDLLKRIHWDCGAPGLTETQNELERLVAKVGRERFGLASTAVTQTTYSIMYEVLERSIVKQRERRFLTAAELHTILDAASRVSIRQSDFDAFTNQLATVGLGSLGQNLRTIGVGEQPPWIILDKELLTPRLIVEREELVSKLCAAFASSTCVVASGATGLGKTLLARQVAQRLGKTFVLVDFHDQTLVSTSQRLDALLANIHGVQADLVILDDLNNLEDPVIRKAFIRVLMSLRQRDRLSVVTCYRKPSLQLAADVGIESQSLFEVPYFSQGDVNRLVALAEGDPKYWGKVAMIAGGCGHPQLVRAFVLGAAARKWPRGDFENFVLSRFSSPDIEASRDEARRRLIAGLPESDQALLFRLSLKIGSFTRDLVTALGSIPPVVNQPGKVFDHLAGVWIEVIDRKHFRVSPLVHSSGAKVLDEAELRAVHSTIARYLIKDNKLSISEVDALFVHALLGRDTSVLTVLAITTISAPSDVLESLAERTVSFTAVQAARTLYPESAGTSALLRLAQCMVVMAKAEKDGTDLALSALLREIEDIKGEQKTPVETIALMKLLLTEGLAARVPGWLALLKRFQELLHDNPVLARLVSEVKLPNSEKGRTLVGTLFLMGVMGVTSVANLHDVFRQLDELDGDRRNELLADCDRHPSEYDLVVSGAWLNDHRNGALDWSDSETRYLHMAELSMAWGRRSLAAYCYKARAIMIDEYGKDTQAALDAVNQGVKVTGENLILARERAKIYWRADQHDKVVEIIKPLAPTIAQDSPMERMFVLREAAISAAQIGDWTLAAGWFHDAGLSVSINPSFAPTVIGLAVDQAMAEFNAGNGKRSLELMADAVGRLGTIEADDSIKSVYTQHIVRHASLWLKLRSSGEAPEDHAYEIIWRPGSGSNLEPPQLIREKPLGPVDYTWYMLAESEIALDVDGGIQKTLRQRLRNGPILFEEIALRKALLDSAIARGNAVRFAKGFQSYLEGLIYLRGLPNFRENFDVMNPQRGDIPSVSSPELAGDPKVIGAASEAILAFAIATALTRRFDDIHELELQLVSEFGSDFAGRNVFARVRGEGDEVQALQEEIIRVFCRMRDEGHLVPLNVCLVALRFSEFAFSSSFTRPLIPALLDWFSAEWKRILEGERFRLKQPALHVPVIEEALNSKSRPEQHLAKLLIATCDATNFPLAEPYKQSLRARASGPQP